MTKKTNKRNNPKEFVISLTPKEALYIRSLFGGTSSTERIEMVKNSITSGALEDMGGMDSGFGVDFATKYISEFDRTFRDL